MMSRKKYIRNIKRLYPTLYNHCTDDAGNFDGMILITLIGKIGHEFFMQHDNVYQRQVRGSYRHIKALEFIRYNIERVKFELL